MDISHIKSSVTCTLIIIVEVPLKSNPAEFIRIFVKEKQHLMHFLEHQIKVHLECGRWFIDLE